MHEAGQRPGGKGLESLLPSIALTLILPFLNCLRHWAFFWIVEMFEGIAVETRKI